MRRIGAKRKPVPATSTVCALHNHRPGTSKMDTAEVATRWRDTRRLAHATVLLLTGAAAHMWLFPSQAPPGHPGLLEDMTAPVRALAGERVAGTTGEDGAVPASTLGETAQAPEGNASVTKGSAKRVRVLIETVQASTALRATRVQPTIEGTPVRLATAMWMATRPPAHLVPAQSPADDDLANDPAGPAIEREIPALPGVPAARGRDLGLSAVEPEAASPIVSAPRVESDEAAAIPHGEKQPDRPSEERLVSSVLQEYRAAYERLDVSAAKNVWPTVDARALGAAFRQLAGQRVTFDSCGVRVSGSGAQATARCTGQAEYVPKVGARRAYVASGEWVFDLAKENAAWRIINANANVK